MTQPSVTGAPRTVIDKLWDAHAVFDLGGEQSLLFIDCILLHERAGPAVFARLREQGHGVAHPELVYGTMDHIIDTRPGRGDATLMKGGEQFILQFRDGAKHHGIRLFDIGDARQGIAHVISPEQGIVLPGSTLVCCDSHTCTLGGIGALAWGIGSSEGAHAVATQTLARPRPQRMRVVFEGQPGPGVSAKDLVLALLAKHGVMGGANHAIEFTGEAVRALDIEGRLTLCNMAVEFGAWTGLVAPDERTFEWLKDRPFAPRGQAWDAAVAHWRTLFSDEDAQWDAELRLDCSSLGPQVTWGTNPGQSCAIEGAVPVAGGEDFEGALQYMDLQPGAALLGQPVDAAFIGSCTNSRLPDLRVAARVVKGRRVAAGVKALVVPGSQEVKRLAESEGLDRIFTEAGFEWRESGCSLCFYAGGDNFDQADRPARRVITSTNRNFEGRQGPGVRSHLASPATVAASAIEGRIADPRPYLHGA